MSDPILTRHDDGGVALLTLNTPASLNALSDAMIAATAQVAGASLATNNQKDFLLFQPYGLRLI